MLQELKDRSNASWITEREPGATIQGFRMWREGGNLTVRVGALDYWLRLPLTLMDSLAVNDTLLGIATVFDAPVLEPIISSDEHGVPVAGMSSGMNVNLFTEQGLPLTVAELSEPIKMVFPVNDSRAVCAWWKEERQHWSYQGLELLTGEEGFAFLTRHLTFFGAIVRGFIMALSCAQLQLLSLEAMQELLSAGWYASPFALLLWLFLLSQACLLAAACVLDRCSERTLDDAAWLVPLATGVARDDEAEAEEPATSLRDVVMAPVSFCFSSAWRDILDELASRWFNFFGEVRSFLESVCGGVELPSLRSGNLASTVSHGVMRALVSMAARRQASASLGLSMDTMCFVTEDERLGELLFTAAKESIAPGSSPAARRLQSWARLHEDVISGIDLHWDAPGSWRRFPVVALRVFLMSNPLVTVFYHCHFQSRSQRVMLLVCELSGAMTLACVFFEASGGAASKKNEEKECEAQGFAEQLGQMVALALASLLIAGIPCLAISSLHSRELVEVEREGCEKWRRKLQQWRHQDKIFWILGVLYAAFCNFFVALFLANVGLEDHSNYGVATAIELGQEFLAIPLGMALFMPLLTSGAVSLAWMLRGAGSKQLMLSQGRLEMEGQGGNWQKKILSI